MSRINCNKCGAEILNGSSFCTACGHPVKLGVSTDLDKGVGVNFDKVNASGSLPHCSAAQETKARNPLTNAVIALGVLVGILSIVVFVLIGRSTQQQTANLSDDVEHSADRDAINVVVDTTDDESANRKVVVVPATEDDPAKVATSAQKGAFDAEKVAEQIVVTERPWDPSDPRNVAYVIENQSGYLLQIEMRVLFKDSEGKVVGTKNNSVSAFEPGVKIAMVFSNNDSFASVEYKITPKEEKHYSGVVSKLTYEANTTKNKAIISVTNNGDIPANFVKYIVLFFNGGKVVDSGWGYTTDSDNEIKPGNTEFAEESCFKDFDSIEVYLVGEGD